ncbi:MAG TPA: ABC transporter ATP-binding protein [Candidatus Aquabacterium excrementipullorum]|nr:ABC transporter ATP-binding protein [Candidatus Aquabacterium excrementipullorum]
MSGLGIDAAVALQAEGLSAAHGRQPVLHGVNLSVRAGQWLALVGPNGAGKSTLLRSLAGLMPLNAGVVRLLGHDAREMPAQERARQLAWLGQDVGGDPAMAVADVVALGRLPHQGWLGWPDGRVQDRAVVEQALADTDMAWASDRTLGALSGGERQRVMLARALAVQAQVLLLDEPVSHLDVPHQRLVAQVLRREAAQGRCVISVLHELPLALAADRLAVMHQGRLLAEGAADDVAVHRALETVFDQAVAVLRHDGRWTAVPRL